MATNNEKLQELSVEEKLQHLYELQRIDTEIDKIKTLRGELPLEVQDLEDEIAGLETRLENLKNEISEADKSVTNKKQYKKPRDERKKVTKMLERVLGNFDEKSLVKKAIGGIIGAVIVCLSLGISGNLEEPVLYFFFSFWLAVGIIYGVNVIRSIMSGCYMTEDFMAKWLVLGVALIIGVIAGGILFAIDIVRWVVYLVAKKKEEK